MEPPGKQRLIVGLGNPGPKYEMTRHNLGYLVVKAFAHSEGLTFKEQRQFIAYTSKGCSGGVAIHLLLPVTYMNESGRAVRLYMDYYKLKPRELIVVSDDVALPYGEMRLRALGSAGGHNGLKSVQAYIGTQEYTRLRMGIGQNQQIGPTLADYVLDPFASHEMERLGDFIAKGVTVLKRLMTEDIAQVMNAVNANKGIGENTA